MPRSAGRVAGSAGFHGNQDVDLLLRDQGVEGLLRAGGAGCIVGDFKHELPAEHAAFGVDLIDRELGGLHDGWRNDAVGAGQANGNADLDGIRGKREGWTSLSRRRPRATLRKASELGS